MKIIDRPPVPSQEASCLETVHSLSAAVSEAMLALSQNGLEALEDALWRQQMLCASLQTSFQHFGDNGLERDALERLVAAFKGLQGLNLTYTEVLRQARASTDLLFQICLDYGGQKPVSDRNSTLLLSLEA